METFYDLLKFILPSLVVFLTAYYIIKQFMTNADRKRFAEVKHKNSEIITPVRLQAYERVILLLERISPSSLVMRVNKSGTSVRFLHAELLKSIRSEFEHNLSQQIYMSNAAWKMVKDAKEEMIKMINMSASKVSDSATGMDLAHQIFNDISTLKKLPTETAIEFIKKEIGQSF
jgi:hypothetical protein